MQLVSDDALKFDLFLSADNVKTAELEQQDRILAKSPYIPTLDWARVYGDFANASIWQSQPLNSWHRSRIMPKPISNAASTPINGFS